MEDKTTTEKKACRAEHKILKASADTTGQSRMKYDRIALTTWKTHHKHMSTSLIMTTEERYERNWAKTGEK